MTELRASSLVAVAVALGACGRTDTAGVGHRLASQDGSPAGAVETSSGVASGAAAGAEPPACVPPTVAPACSEGLCRIEPGCFSMGTPLEQWNSGAEEPVPVILTHPFLIGQTEVTRELWQSVGWDLPVPGVVDPGPECEEPSCPVNSITFYDALSFANRYSEFRGLPPCYSLSGCTGTVGVDLECTSLRWASESAYACEGFRLPTEAEWEYAARGGTTTDFYTGPLAAGGYACVEEPNLEPIAWYCCNAGDISHEVRQLEPNGWGLFDMLGNVMEWCNDLWHPYGDGPLVDPSGVLTPGQDLFPEVNVPLRDRILRGGYFDDPPWVVTTAWRRHTGDAAKVRKTGMRLARTAPK